MLITRNQLFGLLSEACEIEHSLACSYLFAAFSLKQTPAPDLDWRQQQIIRRWAGQIYFVASQEMLHLAQAWNLLSAIGGTPYFMHPAFPQAKAYWPLPAALTLQRFSVTTVERFMNWEAPLESEFRRGYTPWRREDSGTADRGYKSVGQLYDLIVLGIEQLPEADLFLGDAALQIGPDVADFPDLVRVTDRASAIEAIRQVQHQGEGIKTDREDSHFGIFYEMHRELLGCIRDAPEFEPAYPVLDNPTTRARADARLVTDPVTLEVMRMFDDIYVLTMRLLGWVFGPGSPTCKTARAFAKAGIFAMPVILKPLGEFLARMPSGEDKHTAGAAFTLQRHVPLAANGDIARRLVYERIDELTAEANQLVGRGGKTRDLSWLPEQLIRLKHLVLSA